MTCKIFVVLLALQTSPSRALSDLNADGERLMRRVQTSLSKASVEPAPAPEPKPRSPLLLPQKVEIPNPHPASKWAAGVPLNVDNEIKNEVVDMTPSNFTFTSNICDYYEAKFGKKRIDDLRQWNKEHAWQKLEFPSWRDGLELTGYYFKSPLEGSPTVVIQHGTSTNINYHTVQVPAYFLQSMNFNVFAANLRNHGDSGKTKNGVISLFDEIDDVLSAWDYVVQDPDGKLGGKSEPGRVGLMGFSLGGYCALSAFGEEDRIPAVLSDSAPFDYKEWYRDALATKPELAIPLEEVWSFANSIAERDIGARSPAVALPKYPSGRKIGAIHSTSDTTVPFRQNRLLMQALEPLDFNVTKTWHPEMGFASKTCTPHVKVHLEYPAKYRKFLCEFWSDVFELPTARCSLDKWVK